ncbi:TetR/AcrR family transcriptional regulator [Actinoplanes sp. NPDC049118]|uniref:TetR/AcrR family transcriptional regulator n=1 Tax=Actinoplanes sp. NPDC049118 TaxID=3155769 RepID=UPI0033CDC10A
MRPESRPRRAGDVTGAAARTWDRRPVSRGDQRRDALLRALDELLHESDLESITIADITARAGVTRSGFYFYFANKASCMAALGADVYVASIAAAAHLADGSLPAARRIERMVYDLTASVRRHHYIYRAMLDARRHSGAIREMWDGYLDSFVAPVARYIDGERAAGHAPAGPHSRTLAVLLLGLSDRVLEGLGPAETPDVRRRVDALATIWLRSIYGTPENAHPRGSSPTGDA